MNYKLRETDDLEFPKYTPEMYLDMTLGERKINDRLRNTNTGGLTNDQLISVVRGTIANEQALRRIEEIKESKKHGISISWDELLRTKLVSKSL